MAETTIEWADYTFNPWMGCQRVSPGCEHCYAETFARRVGHGTTKPAIWGPTAERRMMSEPYWREPLKWDRKAAAEGVRRRVFCASMADVFEDRPDLRAPRARLFGLILSTPNLDWLLLTKRPESANRLWSEAQQSDYLEAGDDVGQPGATWRPNVWLGTTVEDQQRADERIPHLLAVPAAMRFLSCEPLLGPVDLSMWIAPVSVCGKCEQEHVGDVPGHCPACGEDSLITLWGQHQLTEDRLGLRYTDEVGWLRDKVTAGSCIDWVIAGGESGPGARPMHPDWARSLRDQCAAAGVPFFFKQWGDWARHGSAAVWRESGRTQAGEGVCLMPDGRHILRDHSVKDLAKRQRDYARHGGRGLLSTACDEVEPAYSEWRHELDRADRERRDGRSDGEMRWPFGRIEWMYRVGKSAAGRILDGRTHDAFPEVRR